MIYFDNAATSFPKPPTVAEAMVKFLAEDAANPGRAGHRMAVAAEQMLDDVRLKLTRLIGGEDFQRMIFTLNCTDALNMAIKGVVSDLTCGNKDKPHVITTVLEHNSVSRPLVAMATHGRIELTRVGCDGAGFVDPQDIADAITPATVLIVMTHASNVLGTIQDAAAVGRIARAHDLLFCMDGAQTIGVVEIDIEALQVDLLAFPGHKSLLGPTGIGGLYVGTRCKHLSPWREGGTGGDSSSPTQPTLFPFYLEGGTPNTVGIAGLGAALDYLTEHSMQKHLAQEQAMCEKVIERFGDDTRFTIYGPKDASRCVGTISLNIEGFDAPDVGSILDDSFEIAVRPGLHCAPYTHRVLGTFPDGCVRISPGAFSSDAELDQLLVALNQIAS